jgi:Uma2 family endonuclease
MAIRSHPLTYDNLQELRERTNDRLELIDGEVYVTPAPTRMHQLVSRRLNELLLQVVVRQGAGEFFYAPYDVKLADGSIVQPDLVAVTRDRLAVFTESGSDGGPDFVVEIVSPSTGRSDRVIKRDLYARHGVPEYWLVDPDARTVTIYSEPREGQYRRERVTTDTAVSVTFPGLSVDLADLFSPYHES